MPGIPQTFSSTGNQYIWRSKQSSNNHSADGECAGIGSVLSRLLVDGEAPDYRLSCSQLPSAVDVPLDDSASLCVVSLPPDQEMVDSDA